MEESPTAIPQGFQKSPDNFVITVLSGRKQLLSQHFLPGPFNPMMKRQDTKHRSKLSGRAQDAQKETSSLPLTSVSLY